MPDIEDRFWDKYKAMGLQVVAIDANNDDPTQLNWYVGNRHVTYPVGLEDPSTKTYMAVTQNYKGLNPFPVDILVGKDGNIAYIAREYDPPTMQTVLDKLLSQ